MVYCLLIQLFLFTVMAESGYCDNSFFYTWNHRVKKKENLFRIGLKYHVPWKQIAEDNDISDEKFLPVGKTIIIRKEFPYGFQVLASWYGKKFHGRKTANGEIYNMYGVSAAHRTLPLGTIVQAINPQNGRSLKLRINDRGPYIKGRSLDLSFGAAKELDIVKQGVAPLLVRIIKIN